MAERRVNGSWELDKDHRLAYRMYDGTVKTFRSELISACGNSCVFGISTRDEHGNDHLRTLTLGGTWQADEDDKLVFLVNRDREKGILRWRNGWRLGPDNEIAYEYEDRATGKRLGFRLNGRWRLDSDTRIAYVLGAGNRKRLEFSCSLESLSLRRKKGTVKFRVGAGFKKEGRVRTLSFTGSWRFGRKLALDLEAGTNGRLRIDLSRRFLKKNDAEAYVRVVRADIERRVEAGVHIPF